MQIPTIDFKHLFESSPGLYLVLSPDLTIVAVSENYLRATMTERDAIIGRYLFDVFPDNPDDADATGVSNLGRSLGIVLKDRKPHKMDWQKYDIRKPDGTFEVRYWSPLNTPVLNEQQEVILIIHQVEDVTETVRLRIQHQKDEEELIVFTGKQYQDLVNNAQTLEKGQNIRNSAKNISQLLMEARK